MKKPMSKRDFLRYSLLGLGAASVSLDAARAFATGKEALEAGEPVGKGDEPWKWSKEAPYAIGSAKGVKCQICPNNCVLREGVESPCRTKIVKNGKLYSIAYGNPCSVHIDPIEKKPIFHYLPASRSYSIATAGCTFACLNCQNWEISQVSPRETENIDLMPSKVVSQALESNCRSIAYTYGEPVAFYEYMYDTAVLAKGKGVKNLLISNGYINEKPLRDLCKVMDAANINLKSFSEDTYQKLNGGSLDPVLNTLKVLKHEGVWLEITNLVVPGWTDKPEMILEMCQWLAKNGFQDTPLHFSRFFPKHKLTNLPYTPLTILDRAREMARSCGLNYVYIGNVPNTPAENTFCPKCKKIVIERKGFTILANNLGKSGCKSCGTVIPGFWG
jgi:pyruvate formate lyase activating enzyme